MKTKQERYSTVLYIVSIMMPEVLVEDFIKCALILGEVGRRGRVLQSFSLRWIGCHLVKVRYQQCKEVRKKVLGGRGRGYSHGI